MAYPITRLTLELPSGEVFYESRATALIIGQHFYRYERRDGQMYSVCYEMAPTKEPGRYTLTEVRADIWNGVL